MNLLKRAVLAPAAIGVIGGSLVAPEAIAAAELASLNGREAINDYMEQQDIDRRAAWSGAWEAQNQVTSVCQATSAFGPLATRKLVHLMAC
jgi:hypothetical protein